MSIGNSNSIAISCRLKKVLELANGKTPLQVVEGSFVVYYLALKFFIKKCVGNLVMWNNLLTHTHTHTHTQSPINVRRSARINSPYFYKRTTTGRKNFLPAGILYVQRPVIAAETRKMFPLL